MSYIEIVKNHCNAVDGTFYDAISFERLRGVYPLPA